ncbi:hypothetical protein N0V83_009159 [Neocucurbitaria cava]|uniref:F-box domain-containing protein n=1 Tax=Neocucurbitaria cava TaxID=798079 RepID=A0A9W8Y0C3_9PLEO|nr:hypothetical protein N0V83_009159 [Neocucurbitaria cava]
MKETTALVLAGPAPDLNQIYGDLTVVGVPIGPPANKEILSGNDQHVPYLPLEIVSLIAENLDDIEDVKNLRHTCKRFYNTGLAAYSMFEGCRAIYPRSASFLKFFALINLGLVLQGFVRKIVLVSEGLCVNDNGYEWAWRQVGLGSCKEQDLQIIRYVNHHHDKDINLNGAFLTAGGYRRALTALFRKLEKLRVVEVRPLRRAEHNPYWHGPEVLKHLSFYRPDLDFRDVYYGGWQYDTTHLRVTAVFDEYTGGWVAPPGAGPQAGFKEDLEAARAASAPTVEVHEVV